MARRTVAEKIAKGVNQILSNESVQQGLHAVSMAKKLAPGAQKTWGKAMGRGTRQHANKSKEEFLNWLDGANALQDHMENAQRLSERSAKRVESGKMTKEVADAISQRLTEEGIELAGQTMVHGFNALGSGAKALALGAYDALSPLNISKASGGFGGYAKRVGTYGAAAVGLRYLSGGTLTRNRRGERDIAGIPFI